MARPAGVKRINIGPSETVADVFYIRPDTNEEHIIICKFRSGSNKGLDKLIKKLADYIEDQAPTMSWKVEPEVGS